jgi:hypothetical protein
MGYVVPKAWIFEPSKSASTSDSEKRNDDSSPESRDAVSNASPTSLSNTVQRIPTFLISAANEPAVIMDAYLQLASDCPMAWDSALYHSRHHMTFMVNDAGALWSPTTGGPLPGPLRYHAYFALATSALALFEPSKYPLQLHLKYLHFAVAEMRQLILHNSFGLDDLLHGISKTLLASVLQGDFDSARAHLGAAASIISQQGGMQIIDSQIGATLRYADFQLAVESLRAPAFPLVTDFESSLSLKLSLVDEELLDLADRLLADVEASDEPEFVSVAARKLVDGATVLAHGFATYTTHALGPRDLHCVASCTAETIYMLLNHCTSVLQKPTLSFSEADPPPTPTPSTYEWIIILLMWSQLLVCFANETITEVTIRMNTVPILRHDLNASKPIRASLRAVVREGLQAWNASIAHARKEWKKETIGDWVRMVDVAAETETAQSVRFAPFMRRLLAIRHGRAAEEGSGDAVVMACGKSDGPAFDEGAAARFEQRSVADCAGLGSTDEVQPQLGNSTSAETTRASHTTVRK